MNVSLTNDRDRESPNPWNGRDRALAAVLFIGTAATGLTPVADGDVYWHLAAGREMVRSGAFLYGDPFSVSAAGREWLDVHWLFQLALFGLHQLGGLSALVIAKCLLVGAGSLCFYAALPRAARALYVPLSIATLFLARHLLLVRPTIVTLVFLAFFFSRLERFRHNGLARPLLIQLLLAQIVWSNCQGLFALGPALIGAYAVGAGVWMLAGERRWFPFAAEGGTALDAKRRFRALLSTGVLCLLGSLCTPYGIRALSLPAKLLLRLAPRANNPFENVAENLPPFALERFSPEQVWHLKWFLGFLALSFALTSGRILLSRVILVAGFVALALIGNRNVLLLYWMAAPIAALQLAPTAQKVWRALAGHRVAHVARWLPHALLGGLLLTVGTAAARESNLTQPSPFHIPVAATEVVKQLSGDGTIFSADHQGGYLIWKLYPRFKPYIDTRLVLRTADEYSEYLALADHPERFDDFQRRQGFSYVILPVVYPDRYLPLITHLYESDAWRLIYTDGSDVVFSQSTRNAAARIDLSDATTTNMIVTKLGERYSGSPHLLTAARVQLATLEIAAHSFDQAERVLAKTDSLAARSLQARGRLLAGDLEGAEDIAEKLLRADQHDVQNLDLMAMLYVRQGRLPTALPFLRRALAIDPFDSEATRLLGTMEAYHHDP